MCFLFPLLCWCLSSIFQVKHPRKVLPPALGESVYAIACILAYDGLSGGIHTELESLDSLTSMVNATGIDKSTSGAKRRTGRNFSSSDGYLKWLMSDDPPHNGPSSSHKSRTPQSNGKYRNDSSNHMNSNHMNSSTFTPTGRNPHQRIPLQGPVSGGASSKSGSFKRPRGSGPRWKARIAFSVCVTCVLVQLVGGWWKGLFSCFSDMTKAPSNHMMVGVRKTWVCDDELHLCKTSLPLGRMLISKGRKVHILTF